MAAKIKEDISTEITPDEKPKDVKMETDPKKSQEIPVKVDRPYNWRDHDTYPLAYYNSRIVTRSQSSFIRTESSKGNLEIFANPRKQQPPGMPHVMEIVKGRYGSVPKTLFTRNGSKDVKINKDFSKKLEPYRKYVPPVEDDSSPDKKNLRGLDQVTPGVFACFGPKGRKVSEDAYYKKVDKKKEEDKKKGK